MRQKSVGPQSLSERLVKDIRRATRKHYSAEDKIRVVLDGLRGEESIAALSPRTLVLLRYDPCKTTEMLLELRAGCKCVSDRTHGILAPLLFSLSRRSRPGPEAIFPCVRHDVIIPRVAGRGHCAARGGRLASLVSFFSSARSITCRKPSCPHRQEVRGVSR